MSTPNYIIDLKGAPQLPEEAYNATQADLELFERVIAKDPATLAAIHNTAEACKNFEPLVEVAAQPTPGILKSLRMVVGKRVSGSGRIATPNKYDAYSVPMSPLNAPLRSTSCPSIPPRLSARNAKYYYDKFGRPLPRP